MHIVEPRGCGRKFDFIYHHNDIIEGVIFIEFVVCFPFDMVSVDMLLKWFNYGLIWNGGLVQYCDRKMIQVNLMKFFKRIKSGVFNCNENDSVGN